MKILNYKLFEYKTRKKIKNRHTEVLRDFSDPKCYSTKEIDNLKRLLKKHDKFKIGDLIGTNIELEHGFFLTPTYKFKKILGYEMILDDWYLKTDNGWTDFKNAIPKDDFDIFISAYKYNL